MSFTIKDNTYAEIAKVYDHRIVFYNQLVRGSRGIKEKKITNLNPDNEKYTGRMTKSGKKTIENRLTSWFNAIAVYNYYRLLIEPFWN